MGFASPGRVHRQGHEEGANAHPKGCDAMTMRTPRLVVCYIDNDAQEAQMRTNVGTTRQSDLAWCVTCCNNCSSFEPDATGATHVLTHTAPSLPSNVPTEVLDVPLVPSSSGVAQSVHQPAYVRPDATGATHVLTHSAPNLPTNVPSLPTNVSFGVLDVSLVPSSSGVAQSVHQPAYVRPCLLYTSPSPRD